MESVFVGTFRHSLDDKGRTSIPAKFRQSLEVGEGECRVYLYPLDQRLGVYPPELVERIKDTFHDEDFLSDEAIARMREKASKFEEVKFDRQGRISIPGNLRRMGELEDEIVFVGCFKMFEIWSLNRWREHGQGGEGDERGQEAI